MDHFAGLDVSVKETSVCIVDDMGKIVREVKIASEPEALLAVLRNPAYHFKRIGLEAGPLSQWLFSALAEAELPVVCVETRHMRAVLKAQINKTDRNDARGIAQMMRAGLYRPVHVKTLRSQKLRMLLTHRKLLQSKAIAIDNDLRGTLRNFGLKVGMVGTVKFEARIRELVENLPDLDLLVEPLLVVRRVLREQIGILQRRLLAIVREDDVCRRLMTVPGVGPVVALTKVFHLEAGGGWFFHGCFHCIVVGEDGDVLQDKTGPLVRAFKLGTPISILDQFESGERLRQTHPTSQIAPASVKAAVEIKGTPSPAFDT